MTNQNFLKHLGLEIKISRIRKDLSRKQVAEKTGLTQDTIGNIENGANSYILNYKRIADALEVDIKQFM